MSAVFNNCVPILMYHEVGQDAELAALHGVMQRNYLTDVATFRKHLGVLRESGAVGVSLGHLRQWQLGRAEMPERPVVITFDDGFAGNHRHAMPLLQEHGFSATFYIISGRVGTRHMMDWPQLRELHGAGAEFGSHTVSHPLMSTLSESATAQELADSRAALQDGLGTAVDHFALPFGDRNRFYAAAMTRAGYSTGATSEVGLAEQATDPFQLPRFSMTSAVDPEQLRRIVLRDRHTITAITRRIRVKRRISRLLGKRNYERLASLVYGVKLKPGERLE